MPTSRGLSSSANKAKSALVVRKKSSSPSRSGRRSPSPNLYGGRRSPPKAPSKGQVRRIISLMVSIMIALALSRFANTMSAEDARKYGGYVLSIFKKFLSIVKYFVGYERQIEAGASAITAVIARKVSSGNYRLSKTNLLIAAGAYSVTRRSGTGVSNFINHMNKRNNSWFQMPGTQMALNEKIRAALITMIAWMISSLNFFAVSNVSEMVTVELRARGILGPSRRQLENAGRRALNLERKSLLKPNMR